MAELLVVVVLAALVVDDGTEHDDDGGTASPAPASPPAQANQRAPPLSPLAIPAGASCPFFTTPSFPTATPPPATDMSPRT